MAIHIKNLKYNNQKIQELASNHTKIFDSAAMNTEWDLLNTDIEHIVNDSDKAIIIGFLTKSEVPGRRFDYNVKYVITTTPEEQDQVLLQHNVNGTHNDMLIFIDSKQIGTDKALIGGILIDGKITRWKNPESEKTCQAFEWKIKAMCDISSEVELIIYAINEDSGAYTTEEAINDIISNLMRDEDYDDFDESDYDYRNEENYDYDYNPEDDIEQ